MIQANNVTVQFGGRALFERVNVIFSPGNCYGIIGANGAGKSTFLKVLSGDLEPQKGEVVMTPGERLSVLEQDHFKYDEYEVVRTVLMGNPRLIELMVEKDALYAKPDFNEEDGIKAGELEAEFADLDGWNAESDAEFMLNKLGVSDEYHYLKMAELPSDLKVKVLLAKALFGNPDILLLDEPTNHLDISAVEWLEDFLASFSGAFIVISHDRYFLDKITNKTIELENKKLRSYKGNYSEFLVKKEAEQKAITEKYENDLKEIERLEGIIAQQRQWNREKNIKTAESKEKVIERIKAQMVVPDAKVKRIRFDFTPKCVSGEDVLEVKDLSKSFDGKVIFENAAFNVKKGERLFLLGDNGCGKTTLLKILMKDYRPDSGYFKFGANLFTGYFDQERQTTLRQ